MRRFLAILSIAVLTATAFSLNTVTGLTPCDPDDPDLLGYWKFDEGSGTTAMDSSNGFDGTLTNGPAYSGTTAPVVFDNPFSLDFDGVDDYVDMGPVLDLSGENKYTMSFWFYTPDVTRQYVIDQQETGFKGYYAIVDLPNLIFPVPDGTDWNETTVNVGASASTWHHAVGTWDGSDLRVYLDGSLESTTPYAGPLAASTGDFNIGRHNGGVQYFEGMLDDVRVYDRVLSDDEIEELADGECFAVFCAGNAVTILGTSGNDVIVGTAGNDVIAGLAGDDTITGLGGRDIICGGPGEDDIDGGDKDDHIFGDADDDILRGGDGKDRIRGGFGDDDIFGDAGNDNLDGGFGDDELHGGTGKDRMNGSLGDDVLFGDDDKDTMDGGHGDDTLEGGGDNDKMDGGLHNDTLSGGPGKDRMKGGIGDDTLEGGDDRDRIDGGLGNDEIRGDGDRDTLEGGLGDDVIWGGDDKDRIDGDNGEDVIFGGGGDDRIDGGLGDDLLCGEDDDDRIDGGIGDDTLDGADGTDKLNGELGDDDCFNGETNKNCEYVGASTGATLCATWTP